MAFDFDDVANLARRKARTPFQPFDRVQPAELQALGYDRFRDIRFRPERAIWRAEGLPFDLMFFHRGQDNPRVRMNEVVATQARAPSVRQRRLRLRQEHPLATAAWRDLDYRRLARALPFERARIQRRAHRLSGRQLLPRARRPDTRYGLSARGLAIDTVGGQGEEFPHFIEFWIVKPAADARTLTHVRAARFAARERRLSVRRARRATRPSSTCARACSCARPSRRSASRRSRACSSSARTSRIARTSGPRSTTRTA